MIQHTINLFTFSELSESAKKRAVQWAQEKAFFDYYHDDALSDYIDNVRYYLELIADIDDVSYSIGFSKSDYFKIDFRSIRWKKGAKEQVKNAPECIKYFFNAVQYNFKSLVYQYEYTPKNYDEFTHIKTGVGYYFPVIGAWFCADIKNLERAIYRALRDIILESNSNDNIAFLLSDDTDRLFTAQGEFFGWAGDIS